LIAHSGQAPAGMPAGVTFGALTQGRINNAGQLLFGSRLTGPGLATTNDSVLWLHDNGDLRIVAREGEAAAGTPAGTVFSSVGGYLNGVGDVTIWGTLSGPNVNAGNDMGIWSQRGDVLTPIAREGDHAPGTTSGVKFGDFLQLGNLYGFQVNNNGQVAFEAPLTGGDITIANNIGIWATDHSGILRLIARKGDIFDANDDPDVEDLRTINSTDLQTRSGGGEDGYGNAFNNSGELVFALSFTDLHQGLFVVSTVPEPSAMLLVAMLCFYGSARRRCGAER
jgi:hypothetical protein